MNMIASVSESSKMLDDGFVLSQVAGKIEFCEVCFTCPSRNKMIIENLSLTVSAGKTVAVVGSSTSGKSTIISLIQRFYDPTSGNFSDTVLAILTLNTFFLTLTILMDEIHVAPTTLCDSLMKKTLLTFSLI